MENMSANITNITNFDTIINLLKKYVNKYKPLFLETTHESFNKGYPIENTYILQIPFNIIPKIVQVLKALKYKNESYISKDETQVHGLTFKSYAYYKEKSIENSENSETIKNLKKLKHKSNYIYFVFCLEDDKNCRGLLLSPNFEV